MHYLAPTGTLSLTKIARTVEARPISTSTLKEIILDVAPRGTQSKVVRLWKYNNLPRIISGLRPIVLARWLKIPTFHGTLDLTKVNRDGSLTPFGIAGFKVVTTVGAGYIVDAFQNLVEAENMKYHGLGTGSTAEAIGDTALVTELTTEYTGNVRATGTTTEASAVIYQTVATNTLDGTPGAGLREHGVFSASTVGVLLDRTVYSSITISSGEGLQSTYSLTITAGS